MLTKVIKKYLFEEVETCEMCGDKTQNHRILGQRLNQSQGLNPKKKTGISVSVMKCSNCGLIYCQPLPVPNHINDHYAVPPEDYWTNDYFEWTPQYFAKQIETVKKILPFHEGMTALDIGAGIGKSMLSLQNAGFDAYGFEPSQPFYERAISKMGIPLEKLKMGTIEELEYPEHSFDFITFGAVAEHLYHPASAIEKALKWLKPNGIIHIEVPSAKYFMSGIYNLFFKLRGTNYVTNLSPMHMPYHIYEFDLNSFRHLGQRLGFKVEYHHIDVNHIWNVPKILHPIFHKWMEWNNTGMQLTVYLRAN